MQRIQVAGFGHCFCMYSALAYRSLTDKAERLTAWMSVRLAKTGILAQSVIWPNQRILAF